MKNDLGVLLVVMPSVVGLVYLVADAAGNPTWRWKDCCKESEVSDGI